MIGSWDIGYLHNTAKLLFIWTKSCIVSEQLVTLIKSCHELVMTMMNGFNLKSK